MLIDTHAHLGSPDFADDLPEVIRRAHEVGVTETIAMATRIETSVSAIRIAETFTNVWACVGIHPLEVGDASPTMVERLRELAAHPRVVAIGEIGLDYHNLDPNHAIAAATKERQVWFFRQQLDLAAELGLNVNLHIRESFQPELWRDALEILEPFTGRLRAVFHCFKGKPEQVAEVAAWGHLVSFTGFVAYPEMPQIALTASQIPATAFMLETDAPYQRPPPDIDQRCEPAHLRLIAEQIAARRGIPLEELAAETTQTAHCFYKLRERE